MLSGSIRLPDLAFPLFAWHYLTNLQKTGLSHKIAIHTQSYSDNITHSHTVQITATYLIWLRLHQVLQHVEHTCLFYFLTFVFYHSVVNNDYQ